MSLATDLVTLASGLLTTYGELVSFSRKVEGAYNTANGTTGTSTDTTFTGYGVPRSYNAIEQQSTTILNNDVLLTISLTTPPLIGDVATMAGTALRVVSVGTPRLQGTALVYKLQLRI